jgi:hypothetical protein
LTYKQKEQKISYCFVEQIKILFQDDCLFGVFERFEVETKTKKKTDTSAVSDLGLNSFHIIPFSLFCKGYCREMEITFAKCVGVSPVFCHFIVLFSVSLVQEYKDLFVHRLRAFCSSGQVCIPAF